MSIKLGNSNITLKVGDTSVSAAYLGSTLVYSPTPPTPHDYSQDYFTIVALGDNFELYWASKVTGNCLSYSLDSGATWSEPLEGFEVTLANSGDTIMLKGSGMTTSLRNPIGNLKPDFTVDYKVQGNIMSLLFGDNFVNQTDLTGYVSAFSGFFQFSKTAPNNHLLSVENLVLPATTLEQDCYHNMFNYCTSITTAPELPATTLAVDCYTAMFNGCTSLTTAPVLSATTLVNSCYRQMFKGCSSLNSITCLATDISAQYCTNNWVQNVAASGTFTKAASMSSWTTGDDGISSGWTVQDYNPPTPTSYTYSITITGLENGDTTKIWWNNGEQIDYNVGNGTYTYTTIDDAIPVDIDSVTDYSLDYSHLDLYSGGSQTVTFTYQGGGGLVQIPIGEDMTQYYGQSIKRLVIGDTTTTANGTITCEYFDLWTHNDYLSISQWNVSGQGQFSSINSLPIDITPTTPTTLTKWQFYSQVFSETQNPFNDLQIEWE